MMLRSYQAELNGSQLVWIDQPPAPLQHQRVLVVIEADRMVAAQPTTDHVQGFLDARGCMGSLSREQVLAGLTSLREDWARDPLDGARSH
jgi:hypothetical protein